MDGEGGLAGLEEKEMGEIDGIGNRKGGFHRK